MKVTYYGHACFAVQVANRILLFDPFITGNDQAKGIDPATIPADYILISHGHDDHLGDAVAIAQRTGAMVLSNYEISVWLEKQGVKNTHALNHGGGYRFDFGRAKLVNAVHSSSFPDGSYAGNPGGFVVETMQGDFYYSGDTALTLDMKLIGDANKLKFAALCIGDNFTMGVEDAINAANFVRCDEVLGLHYNTFPPIRIDTDAAIKKFSQAHKRLHLLHSGESREF